MTEVSIRGEIRNAAQQSWLAADSVQCMFGTQSLPTLLITSGSWVNVGHELIAASLLIMAGGGNGKPLDYGELERWTRAGSERGRRFSAGSGLLISQSGCVRTGDGCVSGRGRLWRCCSERRSRAARKPSPKGGRGSTGWPSHGAINAQGTTLITQPPSQRLTRAQQHTCPSGRCRCGLGARCPNQI